LTLSIITRSIEPILLSSAPYTAVPSTLSLPIKLPNSRSSISCRVIAMGILQFALEEKPASPAIVPDSARWRAAMIVRRHAGARRLLGIVELWIACRLAGRGLARIALVRGLGPRLVGGLLLALLVPDHAVVRLCHGALR